MPDHDRAQDIQRINEQLAGIRGSARAQDGSVIIETDVAGRITELWVADWAMEHHGPERFAGLIMNRHKAALESALDVATQAFDGAKGSDAAAI